MKTRIHGMFLCFWALTLGPGVKALDKDQFANIFQTISGDSGPGLLMLTVKPDGQTLVLGEKAVDSTGLYFSIFKHYQVELGVPILTQRIQLPFSFSPRHMLVLRNGRVVIAGLREATRFNAEGGMDSQSEIVFAISEKIFGANDKLIPQLPNENKIRWSLRKLPRVRAFKKLLFDDVRVTEEERGLLFSAFGQSASMLGLLRVNYSGDFFRSDPRGRRYSSRKWLLVSTPKTAKGLYSVSAEPDGLLITFRNKLHSGEECEVDGTIVFGEPKWDGVVVGVLHRNSLRFTRFTKSARWQPLHLKSLNTLRKPSEHEIFSFRLVNARDRVFTAMGRFWRNTPESEKNRPFIAESSRPISKACLSHSFAPGSDSENWTLAQMRKVSWAPRAWTFYRSAPELQIVEYDEATFVIASLGSLDPVCKSALADAYREVGYKK